MSRQMRGQIGGAFTDLQLVVVPGVAQRRGLQPHSMKRLMPYFHPAINQILPNDVQIPLKVAL